MTNENVNFGYQKVSAEEKTSKVYEVFKSVSPKYDIMNDVMSFGLHHLWKKHFISKIPLKNNAKILDLAAGSGDISRGIIKKYENKNLNLDITISDINENMLEQAKQHFFDKANTTNIDFKIINAEEIDFPDNSLDLATISFGIRNVTNIPKALAEIHRVLKPGGKFMCLEFTPVEDENIIKKLYDFYSFKVLPKMGKIIAKDEDSYKYLAESIRVFPEVEEFKNMLEHAGLSKVKYEKLNFGIVAIHSGWKI